MIQMTRAEYQAKYGTQPQVSPTVKPAPQPSAQPTSQPIQMTRQQYQQKYGVAPAISQPKEQLPPTDTGEYLSGMARNIIPSAGRAVRDIIKPILHPVQTVKGMVGLGAGLVSKVIPGKQESEKNVDAVVDFYKNRYGKDLRKTVYEDPFGVIMDVSTLAGGAGAVAKGAGVVSKSANLSKVGKALTTASRATDPLELARMGVSKFKKGITGKVQPALIEKADRAVTSGLGNPAKQTQAAQKYGRSTASFIDEYGLYDRNPATAKEVVGEIGKKFDTAAMTSGKQIPVGQLVKSFDDKIAELSSGTGGVISDNTASQISELTRRKEMLLKSLEKTGTETIPAESIGLFSGAARKYGSKEPRVFAQKMNERYLSEMESKAKIDSIADSVSAEIPGSYVAKSTLKGFKPEGFDPDRAVQKIMENQEQNIGELKDVSRNAIVVSSVEDTQKALQSLLAKDPNIVYKQSKNYFETPNYLGYRGINLNWRNPETGFLSEIQINIPEIMYVKEPPNDSKYFMSPEKFAELQKSPLVAGMGHKIYETVRKYESKAIKEGRTYIDPDGQLGVHWNKQELPIVMPLIQQSNQFYADALSFSANTTLRSKSGLKASRSTTTPLSMKSAMDTSPGGRMMVAPPSESGIMAANLPSNSKNTGNFIQSPPLSDSIIPSTGQKLQVPKVLTGSTEKTLFSPINAGVDELTTFRRKVIDPDVPKSEFGLSPKDTGKAGGVKASRDIIRAQTIKAVPELQKLGMDYGMAKEVAKIMEASASRLSNRQRFNFTKLGSAGIGMWLKGIPGLIGGFATEQIVNSPKFSEIASKILRSAGEAEAPKTPAVFSKSTKGAYLFGKAGRFSNQNQETTQETKVKQSVQK